MVNSTVNNFWTSCAKSRLLEDARLTELRCELMGDDPLSAARRLVEYGDLTRWQAGQLLAGRHAFRLGKYLLLERIGKGGMGSVFKARQITIGRIVALKLLATNSLTGSAHARFRREMEIVAALNHPNIVSAIDADCDRGIYFLAMEYVAGRDLSYFIRKFGQLPVAWACECIRQAALGLQHAHEHGLVHRDIKPSNILVTPDQRGVPQQVKVLDLGMARIIGDELQSKQELTVDGIVLGTPDYMSPEQARRSSTADIRSDIYSLGCTLFKLLTGRPPFDGQTTVEKLMARATDDPPRVRSLRADVPQWVDELVHRMLARKPAERPQTPAEIAKAIDTRGASLQLGDHSGDGLPADGDTELRKFFAQLSDEDHGESEADETQAPSSTGSGDRPGEREPRLDWDAMLGGSFEEIDSSEQTKTQQTEMGTGDSLCLPGLEGSGFEEIPQAEEATGSFSAVVKITGDNEGSTLSQPLAAAGIPIEGSSEHRFELPPTPPLPASYRPQAQWQIERAKWLEWIESVRPQGANLFLIAASVMGGILALGVLYASLPRSGASTVEASQTPGGVQKLEWQGLPAGSLHNIEFQTAAAGDHDLKLRFTSAPGEAPFAVKLDGRLIHYGRLPNVDGKQPQLVNLGKRPLTAGAHTLSVEPNAAPSWVRVGGWQAIGPFDNQDFAGVEHPYPPEKEFDVHKEYEGRHKKVRWKKTELEPGRAHDLTKRFDASQNALGYFRGVVHADRPGRLTLYFAADDTLSVWQQDQRVFHRKNFNGATPFADKVELNLAAGDTPILIKVGQGHGTWTLWWSLEPPPRSEPLAFSVELRPAP